MSGFCDLSNDLHFAPFTLDGHDIDWQVTGFGNFSKFLVEFLIFFIEIFQRTKPYIGQTISTKINRRPRGSFRRNLNRSN